MEIITKLVPTKFLKTDKFELNLHDVIGVLEKLEDTDLGWTTITIYDKNLEKWLIQNKAAKKTTKGSVVRGENYDMFVEVVNSIIYKNEE